MKACIPGIPFFKRGRVIPCPGVPLRNPRLIPEFSFLENIIPGRRTSPPSGRERTKEAPARRCGSPRPKSISLSKGKTGSPGDHRIHAAIPVFGEVDFVTVELDRE